MYNSRAGKYDRLLTIQTRSGSANSYGEVINTYSNYKTDIPCSIVPIPTGEVFQMDQRVAESRTIFAIRYPMEYTVDATMQIVFEGSTGNVVEVEENVKMPRRQELLITVIFKDNT